MTRPHRTPSPKLRSLRAASLLLLGALSSACAATPPPKTEVKPAASAPPVDPRYAALPVPGKPVDFTPPAVLKVALPFGATLWHLERGPLPLVSVHLILPLGSAADPSGKEGLSSLTADLLDEGAGSRSALELSDEFGRLAVDYSATTGVDYVILSLDALTDTFEDAVALLADIVQRPQLSKDEFERRKAHHLAAALSSLSDQDSRRQVALHRVLFGEGYASAPAQGSDRSLSGIKFADVQSHARRLLVPDGAHFIVTGGIGQAEAGAAIERHFARWTGKGTTGVPPLEAPPQPSRTAYIIDFPGAAQSALSIATRAGAADDPNFFPETVMNEKLGGTFTGRINMNLREDKGYTYGAFGTFRRYLRSGYYAVNSSVVTEATAPSVREIFKELGALCGDKPLTTSEYQDSVAGLLLGYPLEFATVSSLGMKLASLAIYGRSSDFWTTWPSKVRAVDLPHAQAVAELYCQADSFSVIVAGDRAKVAPELAALGLTIVVLDKQGHPLHGK